MGPKMTSRFEFTINSDGLFPNKKVDIKRLELEIRSSSIPVALNIGSPSVESGNCVIEFKSDLNQQQVLDLESIIMTHSGEPLPVEPSVVTLAGPKQKDGSPYFSPCMFPTGVYLYITGADDKDAPFYCVSSSPGDSSFFFEFEDRVLIAGGGVTFRNAEPGDWVSMEVMCPATPITVNQSGTGNCNIVNGIIVPAAGNGTHDVDLSTANPVITPDKNGFWEWDFPEVGRGTVSMGVPGASSCHLIAVDVPLTSFVNRSHVIGGCSMDFTIPAIEPKIFLPHWRVKVTVHHGEGTNQLALSWYITTARAKTV